MSWELANHSTPVARKEYRCEAWPFIDNSGYVELDFDAEEWEVIQIAKAENFKIKKGDKYVKITGKWEGDFEVFRARADLDAICHKYELYCE